MSKIDQLSEVVAPALLRRAADTSKLMKELGIPHVLIGGLAVGVHGHPRATKDIDFLVGEEAFASTTPFLVYRDELKGIVHVGETDIMSVPEAYPALAEELRLDSDLPIISLRGLVLMKLDAFRARDQEDVRMLLTRSSDQLRGIRDYLKEHAPLLLERLGEVLASKG